MQIAIGFVTDFFDTLGIGSFATTSAAYRLLHAVPDERIVGTMIIGHSLPIVVQAFIFVVAVQVEALDRQRLLGDVATALSDHQVNILSGSTAVGKDRLATLRFTFELADITHLSSILQAVKRVPNVYDAYRIVPR